MGEQGNAVSVALTERFIEVMESEHREFGLGDPTLGRTVRKLVGSLARRTALWRSATAGELEWSEASRQSLFKQEVESTALDHDAGALRDLWSTLARTDLKALAEGRVR